MTGHARSLHPTAAPVDRALTPDQVVSEILGGAKDRQWFLRRVPAECRVAVKVRPPLFWEAKVRAWWLGQQEVAS